MKRQSWTSAPADERADEMLIRALAAGEAERLKRPDLLEKAESVICAGKSFVDFSREISALKREEPANILTRSTGKMDDMKMERDRVLQIQGIADRAGMSNLAHEAIESGMSIDEFRAQVLEKMGNQVPIDSTRGADIGMSQKEIERYSFTRLILGLAGERGVDIGLEVEASKAVASKLGRPPRGMYVPDEVLTHKRDLTVGAAAAGGNLVATDLLASSFIELLRGKMVVRRMGATILGQLRGNVAIPGFSDAATAYWVGENVAVTESQPSFRQVTMEPHTLGGLTEMSRRLLLQSNPYVEDLVRSDLSKIIAIEIDRAAINGSGVGAQPLGLLNSAGIGNVTWNAAAPLNSIVELETDVAALNADVGALAYLTCPRVRGLLKRTHTNTTYGETPLWSKGPEIDVGELNGYRAYCSSQCPDHLTSGGTTGTSADNRAVIIFGNWNDLVIGEWSGLDVLVDPYTHSDTGALRIIVFMDVDFCIRHVESFSYADDVIV